MKPADDAADDDYDYDDDNEDDDDDYDGTMVSSCHRVQIVNPLVHIFCLPLPLPPLSP